MKENCAIVAAQVELLHAAKSTMKTAGQVPWQHQPEGLQDPVSTDIDVALVKWANSLNLSIFALTFNTL